MTVVRAVWIAALCGIGVSLPAVARACAVCTSQDDAAFNVAMLKGTALLSLLPLALVGGVVWYLRRRAREIAAGGPAAPRVAQESPR